MGLAGGGCGTDPQRSAQLIQIMAVGAVKTAIQAGELRGMEEDDVRDIDDVADRLKSLFANRN